MLANISLLLSLGARVGNVKPPSIFRPRAGHYNIMQSRAMASGAVCRYTNYECVRFGKYWAIAILGGSAYLLC